ncbi:MAG: hypothetical protein PHU71_00030 [Candidatus Gracilibacteria bacterium]|nr:hypothetical protein [Candidatus Gracilibacteria bacterium]
MGKYKILNGVLSLSLFLCVWGYFILLYANNLPARVEASPTTQIFEQGKNYYQKILEDREWPSCEYASQDYSETVKKAALGIDAPEGESSLFSEERVDAALQQNLEAFWPEHLALEEGNLSSLTSEGTASLNDMDAQKNAALCEKADYEQKHVFASQLNVGVLSTGINEIQSEVTHTYQMVKEKLLGTLTKSIKKGVAKVRKKFTQKGG